MCRESCVGRSGFVRDSACINVSSGALSSAKTFGERERTCEFLSALSPPIRGTVEASPHSHDATFVTTRRMFAESGGIASDVASAWDDLPVLFFLRTTRAPSQSLGVAKIPSYNTPVRNTACMRAAFKCRPVATRIRITVDLAESQNAFLPRDAFVCQVAQCVQILPATYSVFFFFFFYRFPPEEKQRERDSSSEGKETIYHFV